MNLVILMGRLVRDPEVRYTQGQDAKAVARFTLAVDRKFKRDEADFISCVAFGKTAEFVEKYLQKGTKVVCEGRWQTGSYEKDGAKVYTNDCMVDSVEFAESKSNDAPAKPQTDSNGFMNIPQGLDDELPFARGGCHDWKATGVHPILVQSRQRQGL